jgi:two-component system OmpR family sensor kinase
MVVAIAGLVAVGLLAVSVSSVILLRSYLTQRVDQQLSAVTHRPVPTIRPNGEPRDFEPSRQSDWRTGLWGFGPPAEVRVYLPDGSLAQTSITRESRSDFGTFAELVAHAGQGPYTVDIDGTGWRVEVAQAPTGEYLAAGVSLADIEDTQTTLLLLDLGVTIVILGAIAIVAATVVRVGLRPLTRMERAATQIAAGDLSRRLEDADQHTESGRLGAALNTMLVRIETAMTAKTESEQRLRQFLADAAHELRTPLTSIQGFAELYRRGGAKTGPDLDEAMGAIEAEVGRMRLLVTDLLLLARLDEERPLVPGPVDLLAVAADSVRDAHVRVPARFVLLGPLDDDEDTFDPVTVAGDEARLRQVATNLVANALQHTPDDAEIVVRVGRDRAACGADIPTASTGPALHQGQPLGVIEVADTGPGLSQQDAVRVFERLYRSDQSRSRRLGGAGLGLSIVAAIVQAHGGRVELRTAPGAGARFRVLLPLAAGLAFDSEPALR